MSGFIDPAPQPVQLGEMGSLDIDGAFGLDFTMNMAARSDTIATFPTLVVKRLDGTAIGSGDIAVSNLTVISGGLKISWTVQGNGNIARYVIYATVVTANGNQLTRAAYLTTVAALG
jgi:hypothetical protein